MHCIAVFVSKLELCAMTSFTCSSEVQWSTEVTVWNFGSYRYFNTVDRLCFTIVKRFKSSSSIETSLVACPSVKYSHCNPKNIITMSNFFLQNAQFKVQHWVIFGTQLLIACFHRVADTSLCNFSLFFFLAGNFLVVKLVIVRWLTDWLIDCMIDSQGRVQPSQQQAGCYIQEIKLKF